MPRAWPRGSPYRPGRRRPPTRAARPAGRGSSPAIRGSDATPRTSTRADRTRLSPGCSSRNERSRSRCRSSSSPPVAREYHPRRSARHPRPTRSSSYTVWADRNFAFRDFRTSRCPASGSCRSGLPPGWRFSTSCCSWSTPTSRLRCGGSRPRRRLRSARGGSTAIGAAAFRSSGGPSTRRSCWWSRRCRRCRRTRSRSSSRDSSSDRSSCPAESSGCSSLSFAIARVGSTALWYSNGHVEYGPLSPNSLISVLGLTIIAASLHLFVSATQRQSVMAHELARSDERYRLVARATRDVVYDWHVASGTIEWTESMQSVFGYAPEQIGDGAWWLERVHPADRDALRRSVAAAVADSATTVSTVQYRVRRADDRYALRLREPDRSARRGRHGRARDRVHSRRDERASPRGAAPPGAEDGGRRPARRRHRARLQQPAHRHRRARVHARAASADAAADPASPTHGQPSISRESRARPIARPRSPGSSSRSAASSSCRPRCST